MKPAERIEQIFMQGNIHDFFKAAGMFAAAKLEEEKKSLEERLKTDLWYTVETSKYASNGTVWMYRYDKPLSEQEVRAREGRNIGSPNFHRLSPIYWEVYETAKGKRVNIGVGDKPMQSYNLTEVYGETSPSTVGDVYGNGTTSDYSDNPVLAAWLRAARKVGIPLRYSWRGISSTGSTMNDAPPWTSQEKDYGRV